MATMKRGANVALTREVPGLSGVVLGVKLNAGAEAMRLRVDGSPVFEGRPAIQLKVEPSTLLRLLADPLYILYEPEQRRMLEYRGISNLHDPRTGRAYTVRIVYPSRPPADAPALPEGA